MDLSPDAASSLDWPWDDDRADEIKSLVDEVCRLVVEQRTPRKELERMMEEARLAASLLCPDRLELFDLIYESRFDRLLEQFPAEE